MSGIPKVSVVIPVYNAESRLKGCLDSIMEQTLEDIEIICVDGHSTDASLRILREYRDPRMRVLVLPQEKRGTGAARNQGLAAARGEYLSFLDAGSFLERETLQTAYQAALEAYADIVVYGSDEYIQNEYRDTGLNRVRRELLPQRNCFAGADIPQKAFHAAAEHAWDKLFQRTFIQKRGLEFQEIGVHNELLFTFAAWASAQRITAVRDVLAHYVKGDEAAKQDELAEWWCAFDALYAWKQYLGAHGLYERFFKDYINYVVHLMADRAGRLEGESQQVFCRCMREDWMRHLGFYEARDDLFYDSEELEACKRIVYSGASEDTGNFGGAGPAPVRKTYDFYIHLPPEKYEEELKIWFKRRTGENLDLEHPKTFNEKIQWLKLYDSTPLKTRLADKYLVRDWVKEKIGEEHLIPLLGVWDHFDEIDFDKLPEQFVLKANHGCSYNMIVKDKSKLDLDAARKKFDRWLQTNYAFSAGLELHYMNIPPKIIAEQYIEELGRLYDYKLMCFGGEVKFLFVITGRDQNNTIGRSHRRTLFTKNWERMPVQMLYAPAEYEIPRPQGLDQMIRLAETLSQGFATVRVDFYEVSGHVYFGEMTFTSDSGRAKTIPEEFGHEMGGWIQLPPKSPIPKRMF